MRELQAHLCDAEVYDAVAVVGLLNLSNRLALATGITVEDDLPERARWYHSLHTAWASGPGREDVYLAPEG